MRPFASRRPLKAGGKIYGTLPTQMVPPLWGRGEFLATTKTIEFWTKAGARHELGTWAAISTYQLTPTALMLSVTRGNSMTTVEITRIEGAANGCGGRLRPGPRACST
jgi:hypothetical protein